MMFDISFFFLFDDIAMIHFLVSMVIYVSSFYVLSESPIDSAEIVNLM